MMTAVFPSHHGPAGSLGLPTCASIPLLIWLGSVLLDFARQLDSG